MELSSIEYKKIAQFYEIPKPTNKSYKEIAEDILAGKLCKCIKKVKSRQQVLEKAAIGVCRKSIFKNRGIDFYTFKCKKVKNLFQKKERKNSYISLERKLDSIRQKNQKKINRCNK